MSVVDNNPFSLSGKTILVTGASSGIGRATAVECAKMGAKVILSAIPSELETLQEVLAEIQGSGHKIIAADLKEENEIHTLAHDIKPLDGLVFAAGILSIKPIAYFNKENILDAFSVNTYANMLLVRELIRANKLRENCSMVFISSIASNWVTTSALCLYASSKAALDSFSKQCALELANRKIRSNTINPGIIRTRMVDSLAGEILKDPEEVTKTLKKNNLMNRLGKPEEVAWMAIYLLSDASSYVTGANFVIDGGLSIKR